jgi:hypothetical protein
VQRRTAAAVTTTMSSCGWVKLMVRVTPSIGTGMRMSSLVSVTKKL